MNNIIKIYSVYKEIDKNYQINFNIIINLNKRIFMTIQYNKNFNKYPRISSDFLRSKNNKKIILDMNNPD